MISSRKVLRLARKWRMVAAIGRKQISFPWTNSEKGLGDSKEAPVVKKGHFALYTTDGRRFEIPLSYLGSGVIRELFAMAEEELGIPRDGLIVLTVDASSMEDVISLIRRDALDQLRIRRRPCYHHLLNVATLQPIKRARRYMNVAEKS